MTPKLGFSLENFVLALAQLEKFIAIPISNDRDRAGIIQAFKFTFEVAWKTVQKAVEQQGLEAGSPKMAFKAAFQIGWIKESEQNNWTAMLEDRNLTSHTYKENIASEVLNRICTLHLANLKLLYSRLTKE